MTTTHVQSFVLISMLRGQPKTPPSGDDLAVLDYHLNQIISNTGIKESFIFQPKHENYLEFCKIEYMQRMMGGLVCIFRV